MKQMPLLGWRKNSRRAAVLFAAGCCALAALPATANLITNGSFEAPLVALGSFTNYLAGSTAITGWTVVGIDAAVVNGAFTQSGITFQAHAGQQWLDLAGVNSNSMLSGVTQTIATLAGTPYQLDFFVGSSEGGGFFFPTTIDLSIGGGPRVSYTNGVAPSNALDWKKFSTVFVAAASSTSITFYNGGTPDNFNSALDTVSVSAVPEPAQAAVLLLGLAAIACVRRQCRRPGAESST
jgi:Protein of unknown function (DUF642)